jgi:D-aspartate ligase
MSRHPHEGGFAGGSASPPPAVILGAGTTALSMARSLRAHGVPVTAIDSERSTIASHSRLFEFVRFPGVYSEEVVDFLEEFAARFPSRPTLLPSGDEHVAILSRHRERLGSSYALNLPPPEVADVLLDKDLFGQLAAREGWPIPATVHCESTREVEAAATRLRFPVVLKPRIKNRATRTNSPRKAFLCDTPAELLEAYRMLAQWEPEAIVQEWIPGPDAQIVFSLHYIDRDGRVLVSFEGRKLRQYLPECGSTSCAEPIDSEEVRELATRILIGSGARGYCSVEFKRDPRTGSLGIIEPTIGRPNLQVGLSAANGVDIVYAGYCDMSGLPVPAMHRSERSVRWVLLPHDIRSALYYIRRGSLTWGEYLRTLAPPLHILPWSKRDYRMVAVAAKRVGRSIRRRLL